MSKICVYASNDGDTVEIEIQADESPMLAICSIRGYFDLKEIHEETFSVEIYDQFDNQWIPVKTFENEFPARAWRLQRIENGQFWSDKIRVVSCEKITKVIA